MSLAERIVRGVNAMHEHFASKSRRRRIVALAAAYAIALSGLIASFSVMPRSAAADQGTVVCHGDAQHDSGSDDNGKLCVDTCCTGCLTSTAILQPPPADPLPARHASIPPLGAIVAVAHFARPKTRSHQSRAPPYAA
jgi:hypothetical protein